MFAIRRSLVLLATIPAGCSFSTYGLEPAAEATTAGTSEGSPAATTPGTSEASPDASTGGTSSVEASSTAEEDASGTTAIPACAGEVVDNSQCGGDAPYCSAQECVGCEDIDCAQFEPATPRCDGGSGRCVECLLDEHCEDLDRPGCIDRECGFCSDHAQCPATACDLETGRCFPGDCVYYVERTEDGAHPCSDGADGGAPETPFCTLQAAVSRTKAGQPCTINVKAGKLAQSEPTKIPVGARTLAILPYGVARPVLAVTKEVPVLDVQVGNRVYLSGLDVTNVSPSSLPAIQCAGAALWLDDQSIYDTRSALRAFDCRVHVRDTVISGQTFGAIEAGGTGDGQLWLENTYITSISGMEFAALSLSSDLDVAVLYTTIALVSGPVPLIDCAESFSGALDVRNSAILGAGVHFGPVCVEHRMAAHNYESNADSQEQLMGTFFPLKNGVLRARADGPLADKAVWHIGNPTHDQDGTARPTQDGALDYAGADRPDR